MLLITQVLSGLILIAACLVLPHAGFANTNDTITNGNLAIIVNRNDPSSEFIAAHYQSVHQIPDDNVIYVDVDPERAKISRAQFDLLASQINAQIKPLHQAVVFLWNAPYQVDCQSITAAFTLGYDPDICKKTCNPSRQNPYFNQVDNQMLKQEKMRLSMLLPTAEIDLAEQVIDGGVKSLKGVFKSKAYYLNTSDHLRNTRAGFFPIDGLSFKGTGLSVVNQHADYLMDVHDVIIYQTGSVRVKHLPTLGFLPGAIADHLTSYGGLLSEGGQMSVLEWLRAGATASYGTVSEPCNYWQKFPNPSVLLRWYVSGDTAIEAYWKSVAWPAQGLFVGDPLAQPFAKH